jgi:2',3'-cyclic-nucleotide 3'-phosphodiesterase
MGQWLLGIILKIYFGALKLLTAISAISLWLMPPDEIRQALKRIMHIKPSSSHSPNSYPRFEPHITLGSAPTLEEARKGLSETRSAIPVRFREVVAGPVFFRSVYIAVAEDEKVMKLEERVRQGLGRDGPPPSYPHLSFAYIDDSEPEERQRLLDEYLKKGIFVNEKDRAVVDCGEGVKVDGFTALEIWIAQCNGPVESWKVLEKIPLSE